MATFPPDDTDAWRALARALAEREARPAAPFGLYLLWPEDPAADLARHVEATVFAQTFGNGAELMAREYGPYEDASVFCCVLDHRRSLPAGALRLILPGPAGLKSLVDIAPTWAPSAAEVVEATDHVFDPGRTWDVATLAVADGYRDGLVSQALYQAACVSAWRQRVRTLVTILDLRVLRLVQTRLGRPFQRYPGLGAARYLDSPASLPVWCDVEAWRARLAASDEVLHEVIFEGRGLEAAVSPPDDWDAFWRDRTRYRHATEPLARHREAVPLTIG
jgi:hypothetical protein